jgi:hypothetical protein
MARIFTTQFNFNDQLYDAIITIIEKEGKTSFNIKVLDLDLQELLPGGVISYEGKEGFKEKHADENALSQALMQSISKAIEYHLMAGS